VQRPLSSFARDLAVQLPVHDIRECLGVETIPTFTPDFFTDPHLTRPSHVAFMLLRGLAVARCNALKVGAT